MTDLPSDQKTREFLLDLMERIPAEMALISRELQLVCDQTQHDVQSAQCLIASVVTRMDEVERLLHLLLNVATQAINVKPIWEITQGEADESTGHPARP